MEYERNMDPVTGALILGGASGVLGGLSGLFGGSAEAQAAKKARSDLEAGWNQYKKDYTANLDYLNDLIGGYGSQTGKYGAKFDSMINNGAGQYNYTAGQFTPDQIQQWLDPNVDYRIQRATEALENSAAGRNKLLSGATQKALQDRSQQIAQEAYESARNFGLNTFQANEAARQNEAAGKAAAGQNAINNVLAMYNSNLGAKTGLESTGVQMRQDKADQGMNYAAARANTRTAKSDDPTSGAFWAQGLQGALQGLTPWATSFGTAFGKKD